MEPISFEDSVSIELWDRDAGAPARDDRLGGTVQAIQAGLGEISHVFKRRSAKYTLTYKVE